MSQIHESPGDGITMQILSQQVWAEACDLAFLTSWQSWEHWSKLWKVNPYACHMSNLGIRKLTQSLHGRCPRRKGQDWACPSFNQANSKKAFLGGWEMGNKFPHSYESGPRKHPSLLLWTLWSEELQSKTAGAMSLPAGRESSPMVWGGERRGKHRQTET